MSGWTPGNLPGVGLEKVQWLLLVDLGVVPPAVHGALVDDEVGHQKLAMARHQQALRLQLVVVELLAELQEGPALQAHELVLSVRRALAGVQSLVASEGRVELDEMALELGRRHIAVVLQNPSWRELWRRRFVCCNKAVVVAPTHGPHGPLLLQAIGHQLHDIVKLPLAKLVEVGGRRREARRGGRRQEAELGPRGATPSKRNLCPGTCRPPPCKGTPAVLLRTHPGPCGGTHREPERGCCCGRRERRGYLQLLRLLRLALRLLARLPLHAQVNGLARRLRLHGRSVRGGCAAFQPLRQAMLTSLDMQPGAKLLRISRGLYFAASRLHAAF